VEGTFGSRSGRLLILELRISQSFDGSWTFKEDIVKWYWEISLMQWTLVTLVERSGLDIHRISYIPAALLQRIAF